MGKYVKAVSAVGACNAAVSKHKYSKIINIEIS